MSEEPNRIAAMAMELMGAKMAHEFLTEAWKIASPEAKQALADAMLMAVKKQCIEDQYYVKSIAQGLIHKMVEPLVQAYMIEHAAEIKAAIEKALPGAIQTTIENTRQRMKVYVSVNI